MKQEYSKTTTIFSQQCASPKNEPDQKMTNGCKESQNPTSPTNNLTRSDDGIAINEKKEDKMLPILDLSKDSAEYYCLAAHLLSPSSSGLYDELLALVNMEVLEIHPSSGVPVLTLDWFSKVDMILLDDMYNYWGSDADPEGRFCINYEMRDTLEEQWIRSDYGWSTADDPNDLAFDFEVIDEWRQAFEGQMEEKANDADGVGRFGL